MKSVTDPIPGTGVSYNDHWAKTSKRVSEIWEFLLRDVIPGPSINKDGTPYTPEELAANPARYLKSYLKNIQDELGGVVATSDGSGGGGGEPPPPPPPCIPRGNSGKCH